MAEEEATVYRACTGRERPPETPFSEAWLVCGRRAGKSFVLALTAVFLATFRSYDFFLAPGERATIIVIAADRKQARTIFRYARALLLRTELLAPLVENDTAGTIDLSNGVTIEIGTASHRTSRGYTFAAVLADEIAFWPTDDAAEPDFEILDALRPGMVTIPNAMLLCASSPYAKRGALWDAFRKHYGKDGDDILVWKASTRVMNPTVPQSIIERAMERDPAAAAAEYGAEFRGDLERIFTTEAVEACVTPQALERPRVSGCIYSAFVDPSGGSSDSMTLAIGHREKQLHVLDVLRERQAPFSPESVVAEFAETLRAYGIRDVTGDRYAGEWPREAFRRHGIAYRLAEKTRTEIYQGFVPMVNSRQAELIDSPRLVAQLVSLERRTTRGGRDSIDHTPGSHDDIANAVAGCLVSLTLQRVNPAPVFGRY